MMIEKETGSIPIIAHIRKTDGEIQTNREHGKGTAEKAERFARTVGLVGWGTYMGLLHDKGKEKHDFQIYIRLANGLPAERTSYGDKTHAYVGALLARRNWAEGYPFVAYALAGHHAGMPDYKDLERLMERELPAEIHTDELSVLPVVPSFWTQLQAFNVNHLVRFLFSCLVDADCLDTEAFMDECQAEARSRHQCIEDLLPMLESYLQRLEAESPQTLVNQIRQQVQQACREKAACPKGVYSLTVPTGGGKTIATVLWALMHALHNGQQRIILSIPYTSIITQTAQKLKEVFGQENVLEHHSGLISECGDEDESLELTKKLAEENWDFPIIVTTNVQLLESMFASHRSACRKLHNVANSVIVFDEVQTLPAERLQPIVDALKTYERFFGTSLLFATASQPTLQGKREGLREILHGFEAVQEIVPPSWRLHEKLRRTSIEIREKAMDYDEIADEMRHCHRVLCIVNTRRDACEIFTRLGKSRGSERHFHLSRMMCGEHIDATIREIKCLLKQDCTTPIRVVSTQLVEAGVDIDFPVVLRQEAGLDSVLQAAGRCNREGLLEKPGTTVVFRIAGRRLPVGTLSYANQARLNMKPQADWFAPEAIEEYFTQYFHQIPSFDVPTREGQDAWSVKDLLYSVRRPMFDTASRLFRLITDQGRRVVVAYGQSRSLIHQMEHDGMDRALFRQLNRYSVTVYERDFKEFLARGLVRQVKGVYCIEDTEQYDAAIGLKLDSHWLDEILTF